MNAQHPCHSPHHKNDDVLFRIVVQRAAEVEVRIGARSCGRMDRGLVVLFGVQAQGNDRDGQPRQFVSEKDKDLAVSLAKLADKLTGLRIFSDGEGKMNLSVRDVAGGLYLISQFTLFADCKKGFRPGFSAAARPLFAQQVYDFFVDLVKERVGGLSVFTGEFAADMAVSLVNDGPVTIIIDADVNGVR